MYAAKLRNDVQLNPVRFRIVWFPMDHRRRQRTSNTRTLRSGANRLSTVHCVLSIRCGPVPGMPMPTPSPKRDGHLFLSGSPESQRLSRFQQMRLEKVSETLDGRHLKSRPKKSMCSDSFVLLPN